MSIHSKTLVSDAPRSDDESGAIDLLRFLTCGSVDDGKSTLIGRLIHDSENLYDDQLAELEVQSKRQGTTDGEIDFALLVDGLQAEREQGITIDVAHLFFSTDRRRFVVADTPGHEQYTRNMATGASTADLAVLLVDARKGVLTQTRRHAFIASLIGIRHVVLAVNKMDLVAYDNDRFDAIAASFREFAGGLGFSDIACIPISARDGDNVSASSDNMKWYAGPTLIDHLETVDVRSGREERPFRLPVQWVNRPDLDFRGYSGTVAGGRVRPGDEIMVSPSGKTSRISRIVTYDGDLDCAVAGDSVTLTLEDELDLSRGDIIADPKVEPSTSDQLRAHIIWMNADPMYPGRAYEIQLGGQTAIATVTDLQYTVNVNTLEHIAGKSLALNEVGVCNLSLDRAVSFDAYEENRETGAFILIDRVTKNTIGAGMIDFGLRRASNVVWQELQIDKQAHAQQKGQSPCVMWFTGLSGSGKSTIANLVEKRLHAEGRHTYILDGDNVRHGLNRDLGFTEADRIENIRRVAEVSKLMADAGLIVLVSFISPFRSEREMARQLFDDGEFLEVYVDTPFEVCAERDPKGLYAKAQQGLIANFTGIDSPYEAPETPELRLATEDATPEEAAEEAVRLLRDKGFVS